MSVKSKEITEELAEFVLNREGVFDVVVPPTVFVITNIFFESTIAAVAGLLSGILVGVFRLIRGQSLKYAFGGLAGLVLAAGLVYLTGRSEAYFSAGILQNILLVVVALVSVLVRRPMVAWTSFIARRWPLEWYWHERVRPAYSEVTLAWFVYFCLQSAAKVFLFQQGEATWLGILSTLTGLPATIVLLVLSYIYGVWRLGNLGGPSVEEFKSGQKPPWKGQKRGF